jgi:stalled ribosome rescue protein Dom34
MSPKIYRRGYPVAILIGVEEEQASIWKVFSKVAKHQQTIRIGSDRKDQKGTYNLHETIINSLRPILKEGVRSVIIASSSKTSYAQDLQNHIRAHHSWLSQGANKATISLIVGSASTPPQVAALTQKPIFKQLIIENAKEETENLLEILERRLNKADDLVLFSLEEAEKLILSQQLPGKPQAEYLLLTDNYLVKSRQKSRLHRLMQIAQNKKVKTKVINVESDAGARLTQLGGLICIAKLT